MSISSASSRVFAPEEGLDHADNYIDQGNGYFVADTITWPVLHNVDEELRTSDDRMDEAFKALIAEFDAKEQTFLRNGRIGEYFVALDARNQLLGLSNRAAVERGECRRWVHNALLDLEARNQHRPQ